MTGIDLLGFAAGTLTTCAFWPQLQKTWISKSAGDVSMGMLAIFSAGVCLWFLYGLVLHAWPIILTNAVTLLLTGAILVLKLRYRASGGEYGRLEQDACDSFGTGARETIAGTLISKLTSPPSSYRSFPTL